MREIKEGPHRQAHAGPQRQLLGSLTEKLLIERGRELARTRFLHCARWQIHGNGSGKENEIGRGRRLKDRPS
jgi:hypothetical protein